MRGQVRLLAAGLALASLAGCNFDNSVGYVEIKTVPVSTVPVLYLGTVKLDPPRNGVAVLREPVGTMRLQTEGEAGQLALLCNIVVQKNRITTVTVSVLSRQLRCQCGRNSVGSATPPGRTCIA